MKDAVENKEEIKQLNKIIMDKDDQITQLQTKVKYQEAESFHLQHQIEELQQKEDDSKKVHKLEITKVNNTLTSNTEEIYRLRNHNKILVAKIKKQKHSLKEEKSNEDLEGRILENQEENQCLKNLSQ